MLNTLHTKFIDLLKFLRLVDHHDGLISLTNVALIIVLVKLAKTPSSTLTDTVPLILALASYNVKKLINKDV